MVTLKINYNCDSDFISFLKECNKVKRIAFNLFKTTLDKTVVTRKIKSSYNINYDLVDASIMECCIGDAYGLSQSCKERRQTKMIFGSLKEWKRLHKGLMSKEEFNIIKNTQPVLFTGKSNEKLGNRKMKLDINNKQIVFKKSRTEHFNLKLITSNSRWKLLNKLQIFFEENSTPVTYKLDMNHIYITFNESILKEKDHNFIKNRIGSLDLNPNYIAFTIQDFKDSAPTQVFKQVFDLTELNKTHNSNKINHEIIEVSKTISELSKHYQCEIVGLEKLTMPSKNHNKGRFLNRLINNTWKKNLFVNNLKKRLNILGIRNQEIICAYSSTVGCLDNPKETDSIAAALEIGRRTYVFLNRFLNKNKDFLDVDIMFPTINRGLLKERWNSILADYNPKNIGYKGIHEYLKGEKKLNELRFLFKDYDFSSWSCFRLKSYKTLVSTNCCYQQILF